MSLLTRVRAAFLADAPADQHLQQLDTNFSFFEGLRRLRRHQWRWRDLQFCVIIPTLIFCFVVCEKPTLIPRTLFTLLLIYLVTAPATGQFFRNFLPTATWLLLFYACRYIKPEWRPPIFVRVLPGLETIFYGGDLSETLSASNNSFCDILAWIPYGLVHFGAPFVVSFVMFVFGPPGLLPVFHFAFGYMNLIGVIIQLSFPNAPPWYRRLYGLAKANYSMKGSAGGLERVDTLTGLNWYTIPFKESPLVFGAFPSLHSGSAVMEALFMSYLFPQAGPILVLYVMWIWWATMYLTHHYFIDLIGGALLSLFVFYICSITILPQKQEGKFGRWSYSYVKHGISRVPEYSKAVEEETYEPEFELGTIPRDSALLSRSSTPRPP